jgi:hypothetical protein
VRYTSKPVRKLTRAQDGAPIAPSSTRAMARRKGGCQRKFSWTASQAPAPSAAATMARASPSVGANGFWTIRPGTRGASASASGRWVSIRVTTSTRSGQAASAMATGSVKAGAPNSRLAAWALAGSTSQTATSSAPSGARSRQLWRWFWA